VNLRDAVAPFLGGALLLATGCEMGADSPAEPTAAAPTRTEATGPVGPLPGPTEAEPRRNPLDGDAQARADGRRYFVAMNCYGCHGGHAGGGMGPSLRDDVWIHGGEAGQIFDSIAQGRANGMPAWGPMLPPDVMWRITAYIESLRTPDEPSPPR
jgi:cytochrome c oxidase cbb3-type subunit 3